MEGLERIFSGKNVLPRQICLFSVCGIAGLINGYFALNPENNLLIGFAALLILFNLFFTGYEILFLKERELPDVDMRSFNIATHKIPFLVFLVSIPILLVSLFTKNSSYIFLVEALLALPLTMLQVGFSFNFAGSEAGLLFKKFAAKDYIVLLLKWIGVMGLCYILTLIAIFVIFFIGGIIFALAHKTDAANFALMISSNMHIIGRIANYLTGILLVYFLTLGTLVWDYEVLKTYEK